MKKTVLMTEGSISRILISFSLPLILGNVLQQLYNAADSVIVGQFIGAGALAAVSSSTFLIYLLIAFSQGASLGASILIARFIGAKDDNRTSKGIHSAILISLILGLALSLGGIFFSRSILLALNTPDSIMEMADLYLKLYSYGLIFNVLYNMLTSILNAMGNSKMPLIYLAISSVLNVILDILFIVVFNMGIAGAAIATNICQAISCILALVYLRKQPGCYSFSFKKLTLDKDISLNIVKLGLPTGIQNMVTNLSNLLVQGSVNLFGADAVAGFGAYLKLDGFNVMPISSLSLATSTFISQNYGAGKKKRIRKGLFVSSFISLVYTLIIGAVMFFCSSFLLSLFTSDTSVIDYGKSAISYFAPFYWVLGLMHVVAGTIRGKGKTIPPMIIQLASLCLFRVLWIKFALPHFNGINGIFILYPISWILGLVMMSVYYLWDSLHFKKELEIKTEE